MRIQRFISFKRFTAPYLLPRLFIKDKSTVAVFFNIFDPFNRIMILDDHRRSTCFPNTPKSYSNSNSSGKEYAYHILFAESLVLKIPVNLCGTAVQFLYCHIGF